MPRKGQPQTEAQRRAAAANLPKGRMRTGDPARQGHLRNQPRVEELYEKELEKLARRLPSEPSTFAQDCAEEVAHALWLRNRRADAWLRTYPRSANKAAEGRIETSIKLSKLLSEARAQLERAVQECIAEAQRPNAGHPVVPRRDPAHVLNVALVLLRQGAIPNASAETRAAAKALMDAIVNDQRDEAARQAELAGLGTTMEHK
jgi:hypothetical protein